MNYEEIYRQYMYSYPHKSAYMLTKRLDISEYKEAFVGKEMGLYLHIPFCRHKCGYCNLFCVTHTREEEHEEYLKAIQRHSHQMKKEINFEKTHFNSLILGGGTPMLLSMKAMENLFDFMKKEYRLEFDSVFSVIESSPLEIEREKLSLLKKYRLKRLSLGIQSFVEEELRTIGRMQSVRKSFDALEEIKRHDFELLNIDLIYGIPSQDKNSFLYSIKHALLFEPEEIFLYPLYKQENAGLFYKFQMDHKTQYELYHYGRDFLLENGYEQLSMRNFVKKTPAERQFTSLSDVQLSHHKAQSPNVKVPALPYTNNENTSENPNNKAISKLHNIASTRADCGFENTLSLGLGGRSYFNDLHFCEPYVAGREACASEFAKYLQKTDFLSDLSYFKLDVDEYKRKYAVKNLLFATGLSKTEYQKHFKSDVLVDFQWLNDLLDKACLIEKEDRLFLTALGMSLSDMIGPMFISENVRKRMRPC